mgnify:CR=1 FL=1
MTKAAIEATQATTEPSDSPVSARGANGLVRVARLLGFLAVVAAAGLAQALDAGLLVDRRTVVSLLPAWIPAQVIPWRSLSADPQGAAQWLALVALVGAALLMPWWRGEQGRRYRALPDGDRPLGWVARGVGIAALVLAAASFLWSGDTAGTAALWGAATLLLLGGGLAADRARPAVRYGARYAAWVAPYAGWVALPVILVGLGLGYGWSLSSLPPRLDEDSARVGLAAAQWAHAGRMPSFAGETTRHNVVTLALPALALRLTGDGLLALRLTGTLTALLLLLGVWLVGCELFRRTPVRGPYDEVLEDDGRWLALLALLVTGIALPLVAYARVPVALDAAAWGVFGLWALLRGLRLGRFGLLASSGVAFGLALYAGPVGLWMWMAGAATWGGVLLLERTWVTGKTLARGDGTVATVHHGVGLSGLGWWLAGVGIVAAPLLSTWARTPETFSTHWGWSGGEQDVWTLQMERAVRGLTTLGDVGVLGMGNSPLLPALMVPLLLLALGTLVLNLDRLVGYVALVWLVVPLLGMSLTVPNLPDWVAYAGLLPGLGLTLAFGLDRVRVLLLETLGTWTLQATVYLAFGVIILGGFFSGMEMAHNARRGADLPALVGVELANARQQSVVLAGSVVEMAAVAESATVRFLAGDAAAQVMDVQSLGTLAPGTRVLVAPGDWPLVYQLTEFYTAAELTVRRDIRATPTLLIVDLPAASE